MILSPSPVFSISCECICLLAPSRITKVDRCGPVRAREGRVVTKWSRFGSLGAFRFAHNGAAAVIHLGSLSRYSEDDSMSSRKCKPLGLKVLRKTFGWTLSRYIVRTLTTRPTNFGGGFQSECGWTSLQPQRSHLVTMDELRILENRTERMDHKSESNRHLRATPSSIL